MKEVICPRCGIKMEFIAEAESNGVEEKLLRYYYRCPACGSRLRSSEIVILRDTNSIILKIQK